MRRDDKPEAASKSPWRRRTERSPEEDAALLAGLATGEDRAFRSLVDRFADPLYRVIVGIVGEDDAEEVVGDVFLQVFRKVRYFRGDAAFSSWIYRIALNAARMRLRARRRRDARLRAVEYPIDAEGHMFHIPDWSNTPERRAEEAEVRARVEAAVAELPEIYRMAFHLGEVLAWPREEVAKALGITPQTLKSRLHRARLHLRAALADLWEKGSK